MKNLIIQLRSKSAKFIFKVLYMIKPVYAADFMYYHAFHKHLDLDNPQDLIEKIYWLLYNTDTTMWTLCADKYRMREYVEQCGLSDYLPKLYGHWDNPKEICFESLPNEFVLKANNGCGTVKVVRDKSVLDEAATVKLLKSWLKPFGYIAGQTHYMRIKPCIIAEELLHQNDELNAISPISMVDYKVWCINGEPESIFVAFNRHDATSINMALYDINWNPLTQYLKSTKQDVYLEGTEIPRPDYMDEMLEMARKLAKPFPEVRVDFYMVEDKPIIGELTFTTGFGYFTDEYYRYLGNKLDISRLQRSKKK